MANLIGRSLGRYRILEQLGEGGMAIVYKAYDTRLERDVAVKIIRRGAFPPDQLSHILKRFEREAKALAKLSHPNIVRVLDYGDHEGSPYLVMEYLPGGTLKYRLGTPIPWQDAVQLLIPIANALEYAHEHKIIHRDIKPSNILLAEKGQPMLTDFGIAKILEVQETSALTGSSMVVGTPEYMAPEQWTGQTTAQSDIYSLGVVFYEMVTGRRPYEADTPAAILIKQASDPLPPPTKYAPNLPGEVEKILLKALAKEAGDRYQDMPALIVALERLLVDTVPSQTKRGQAVETVVERGTQTQTEPVEQLPTGVPARPARSKSFIRGGTWALIALFVVTGGYFVWNGLSNGPSETATPVEATRPSKFSETSDPTATAYPTYTPYPTNTPYSTTTPYPTAISQPEPTRPPTIVVPYFSAIQDMFCYDGPATTYETHWELYAGQTAAVLAKWSGDAGWLAVDINDSGTRTDCCWVESHKGTLNVSLDQIKSTSIVPDRMNCSALK